MCNVRSVCHISCTSERRAVPAPLMTSWCCSCWEVDLKAFESFEFRIHRSIPNDDRGILDCWKDIVRNVQSLVFCSIFGCSLFVFFVFWPLHYRFLFNLQLLISPFISSNVFLLSSWNYFNIGLLKGHRTLFKLSEHISK
jgi:hypothetical protein